MLKIKVRLGQEWRRLSLNETHEDALWDELCDNLRRLAAPGTVTKLIYKDEDGDNVLVGSPSELQEVLHVFASEDRAPKFLVHIDGLSIPEEVDEHKEAEDEGEVAALKSAVEADVAAAGEIDDESQEGPKEAESAIDESEASVEDNERAEFLQGLYRHVPNEARIVVSSLLCSEIERLQLTDAVSIFVNNAFPFFASRDATNVLAKADTSGESVEMLEDHFLALSEEEILVCVRRGLAAVRTECPQLCSALSVLARLFNAPKIELDRFLARLIAGNRWPSGEKFDLSKWLAQTASSIRKLFAQQEQQQAPQATNEVEQPKQQKLENLFTRTPRARFVRHEGRADVRTGRSQGSVLKGWVVKNTSFLDNWPTQVRLELQDTHGLSEQLAALNDKIRLNLGGDGIVRPAQVVPIHVRLTTPRHATTCRLTYRLSYLDDRSLQWHSFGPLLHATVHVFDDDNEADVEGSQQQQVPQFVPDANVANLVELGCAQDQAVALMQQSGGNFEKALEQFLAQNRE
ncbi:MAG: hypothetical protein MHM6MM_006724 [Cercozoa sp. M6MM]